MNKQLRQIIREEVFMVMREFGDDPIKITQDMVKSAQDQVDYLENEYKFKQADTRVSNMPKDEKDARVAAAKLTKDRLDQAKKDLEMAKKAEVSAVQLSQTQTTQMQQNIGQSQIQSQT